VVINLLTNTLSAITDQPLTPAARQPSTAVVNNNNNDNNDNQQYYAAAAPALDQLDALLAQLANQRDKFNF